MEYRSRSVVLLPSTAHFRAIPFQETVLPPFRALTLCTIARKSQRMTDFSRTGSRNMAETCAINFWTLVLFDFYSDRESTATPFGRSNVRWCGLRIFSGRNGEVQFSSFFCNFDRPWNKNWKCLSSDFRNTNRLPDVVFKLNEKLSEC